MGSHSGLRGGPLRAYWGGWGVNRGGKKGYPAGVSAVLAQHSALLEVDEEGVTGAACTAIGVAEAAREPEEEIEFALDRPFLFLVTGKDGSLLFSGAVRNLPNAG